jgi:hypothetical protein
VILGVYVNRVAHQLPHRALARSERDPNAILLCITSGSSWAVHLPGPHPLFTIWSASPPEWQESSASTTPSAASLLPNAIL